MRIQGRYWLLTVKAEDFCPQNVNPEFIKYIKGQQELGENTGFLHWQLFVLTERVSLKKLKDWCPTAHIELSRSEAAEQYVWKEATRVEGTQFEYGMKPLKRNSKTDWERVRKCAEDGDLNGIPSDIYVVSGI